MWWLCFALASLVTLYMHETLYMLWVAGMHLPFVSCGLHYVGIYVGAALPADSISYTVAGSHTHTYRFTRLARCG